MTARTHDLAAFTLVMYVAATNPIPSMSIATLITALGASIMGATAADLDEPTAALWQRIPAGSILGRLFHPFTGGHRLISHSLLGMTIAGFITYWLLEWIKHVVLVDMSIIWTTFMLGYLSHLVADTFTKQGVPWLFPIPIRFGFPPFRFLRITTGEMIEKGVVFPGLLLTNIWIVYTNYNHFVNFFLHNLKK